MSELFFASSLRTGLSTAATGTDLRPSIDAEVRIGDRDYTRVLELAGSADVASIDPSVWGVMYPAEGALDAEPTFMPSITVAPADLPWRLSRSATPIAPWLGLVVIPETDGVTLSRSESSSSATLTLAPSATPSAVLPDLNNAHQTAHVQADTAVLSATPSARTARLISLTPLAPETHYLAAVVPFTAEGVAAGLGLDTSALTSSTPAWDLTDPDLDTNGIQLPAFASWRFATGEAGDFASLTRRISGDVLPPGTGLASLEVSSSGSLLPAWDERPVWVDFEGALGSPDNRPRPWSSEHRKHVQPRLETLLNESVDRPTVPENAPRNYQPLRDDPIVAPPLYGELNAALGKVPGGSHWARTLNLNPQWRSAAGVGARAVRARQSDHLAAAWEQLRDALEAVAATNRAQLAATVGQRVGARLGEASDEVVIAAVSGLDNTMLAVDGFNDPVMVRSMRPSTAVGRAFASAIDTAVSVSTADPEVIEINSAARSVRAATRAEDAFPSTSDYAEFAGMPDALVDSVLLDPIDEKDVDKTFHLEVADVGLAKAVQNRLSQTKFGKTFTSKLGDATGAVLTDNDFVLASPGLVGRATPGSGLSPASGLQPSTGLSPGVGPAITTGPVSDLSPADGLSPADVTVDSRSTSTVPADAGHARALLDPSSAVVRLLAERVPSPHILQDVPAPQPIGVQLRYDNPFINEVLAIDQRFVIPGLSGFAEDSMALAEVNSAHVAAVLAGANDELLRELLWHGVPIDPVQTPIRRYWPSGSDDVAAMAQWSGSLSKQAAGTANLTVVLVRAELFSRYPEARILAVQAELGGGNLTATTTIELPIFEGWLDRSTRYVAFGLDAGELTGDLAGSDPGWFIGFEESSTGPRFRTADAGPGSATRVAVDSYAPPFRGLIHASELTTS